ncbi:hypothetical protein Hdeb2414_s0013g00413601 [Helianthus debilis subsp. tardiflorus]
MLSWPALFALEKDKGYRIRDRLPDSGDSGSVIWDWLRQPTSQVEVAELQGCEVLLAGMHVSEVKDKWKWTQNASGIYSTHSFKESFKELSLNLETSACIISVKGCRWVLAKCNIFIWRSGLDHIPTKCALIKRNIPVESNLCVFCNE